MSTTKEIPQIKVESNLQGTTQDGNVCSYILNGERNADGCQGVNRLHQLQVCDRLATKASQLSIIFLSFLFQIVLLIRRIKCFLWP